MLDENFHKMLQNSTIIFMEWKMEKKRNYTYLYHIIPKTMENFEAFSSRMNLFVSEEWWLAPYRNIEQLLLILIVNKGAMTSRSNNAIYYRAFLFCAKQSLAYFLIYFFPGKKITCFYILYISFINLFGTYLIINCSSK